MRPITKAGLSLVALIGIGQALLIAALLWPITPVVTAYRTGGPAMRWLALGLTAGVALVFVVMLLVALFRQSTTNQLVLTDDRGTLSLSRQALENAVAKAIIDAHPVKGVAVTVKLHARQQAATVDVVADSLSHTDLAAEGQRIEATAKHKAAETLGVPVKRVRVSMHPANQAGKRRARVL
ncbi:alkaline shock response membrane anchor protein AmaP [Lacticaseibacillus daqingensis]|uniref:alkaline shock response membrane anchor protein AmaP n=1 Tax=Lacticaseibacillus daqingensis TaxID=2486014 RepID=UPI0013DE4847|nr:alkaline shock response membrane anchor protein AmaP [Lacticaseibacillus daqingensis]